MNAPARITVPRDDVSNSPYAKAITINCPNQNEWQMASRIGIAEIREQSAVGMARASGPVSAILYQVSNLASAAIYADLPASRLIRIRSALALGMEAAREIERATREQGA